VGPTEHQMKDLNKCLDRHMYDRLYDHLECLQDSLASELYHQLQDLLNNALWYQLSAELDNHVEDMLFSE
jgi:hypothetical protein